MGEGQGVLVGVRTRQAFRAASADRVVKAPVKARCFPGRGFPHPEGRAHGRVSHGPSRRTVTGRSLLDFSMSLVRGQSCHAADTNRAGTDLSRNEPVSIRPAVLPGSLSYSQRKAPFFALKDVFPPRVQFSWLRIIPPNV